MIWNKQNEVEYLTFHNLSDINGVKHLFSTKLGGVSQNEFASMNLSYTRGDCKEHVDENFRRISRVLQVETEAIVCSDQTHTSHIRVVTQEDAGKGVTRKRDYTDVDGLLTNEKKLVLATFYADCVPLYFVDPKKRIIGLAHSGWRGSVLKIGKCMVQKMQNEFGCSAKDIIVGIGPSICQECYEVDDVVVDEIKEHFEHPDIFYRKKENHKYQLDLWKLNKHILLDAGILEEHIELPDLCTCCNHDKLFSHRATGGKRGNLGAFLVLL